MRKTLNLFSVFSGRIAKASTLALTFSLAAAAYAAPINVVNGNFEQSTGNGQVNYNTTVTGWSGTGYNFLYTPGTADTTGANGDSGNVKLWGPGDGSQNGLTASPAGGNFIGMDGVYQPGAISQTLSGLTVGQATVVSFYYAGAQQYNFSGLTTEGFAVSLGDQTINTPILANSDHGFTSWQLASLTFTPTQTSEVLSFLALGTPNGEPPFSLLDGVSVNTAPTPEPSTITLLLSGVAGLGGVVRRRIRKA